MRFVVVALEHVRVEYVISTEDLLDSDWIEFATEDASDVIERDVIDVRVLS